MSAPVPDLTGRRLRNAEERVSTLEETAEAHEITLYELRRQAARDDLRWARLLAKLGIADVTDADVDAALDEQ